VREVIAGAERIVGHPILVRESSRRPGDPPTLVADPSHALALLGLAPAYSDLDTILKTALAFKRNGFAPR
jgi:UDP-glucose 4-epimerase